MKTFFNHNSEGGRIRPPSIVSRTPSRSRAFWCVALVSLCLLGVLAAFGQVQYPRRGRSPYRPPAGPRYQRPVPTSRPAGQRQPDPTRGAERAINKEALELLRKKLHPTVDFAGEQQTEVVTAQGSHVYQQKVKGDTKGRIRVDFVG